MSVRRAFLFVALALVTVHLSACARDSWLHFYGRFEQTSDTFKLVGSALSIAEVEATYFKDSDADWQKLKARMKPGDELYRFSDEEWHEGYGYTWSGYALVRQGRVIATITTSTTSFG